jgi:hypothetical protein
VILIVTEITKLTLQATSYKFRCNNMEMRQESVTSRGFPRSPAVNPRNWLSGVVAQEALFISLFTYCLCQ